MQKNLSRAWGSALSVLALAGVIISPLRGIPAAAVSVLLFALTVFFGREIFTVRTKRPGEQLFAAAVTILSALLFFLDVMRVLYGEDHPAGLILLPAAVCISLTLWSSYLTEKTVPGAVEPLGDILPKTCTALLDGIETEVATYELSEGDVVAVSPGDIIPCDGVILAGKSDIDERNISGGLLPQLRSEGDTVIAGTRNLSGFLTLRSFGTRTELDGMRRIFAENAVREMPAPKGRIRLMPIVAAAAAAVVFVLVLFLRDIFSAASGALAVLAVLSPCGFGISSALMMLRAGKKGEPNGLKIRDLWALDSIAKIQNAVFTRSGTATVGKLTPSEIIPLADVPESSVIRLAAALSDGVDGADFSAITAHCRLLDIQIPPCIGLERLPGRLTGIVDGVRTVLLAEPSDIEPYLEQYPELTAGEKALRLVVSDSEPVGIIALADKIKPSASAAFTSLVGRGIRAALISGGIEEHVAEDAETLGARDYAAGLGPMEKERFIRGSKEMRVTAAVGDGFCDCAALISANCSFAMASGAEEAKNAASAILLRNDLRDILTAISLANAYRLSSRLSLLTAVTVRALTLAAASAATLVSLEAGALTLAGGMLLSALVSACFTVRVRNEE